MTLAHGFLYYIKKGEGLAIGTRSGGGWVLLRVTPGPEDVLTHTVLATIYSDHQARLLMESLTSLYGSPQTANGVH